MKVAIHHREGSFSEKWITYCKDKNIDFRIVDAFSSNIIDDLKGCDYFLWHHHHALQEDILVAKRILFSLEQSGIKVYPDFNSGWHFDDKVGQKYLLELINAPLVKSYVFYNRKNSMLWAKQTTFPKVFKLRGGAGAKNVILVKNSEHCQRLIKKAFRSGITQNNLLNVIKDDLLRFKKNKSLKDLAKIPVRFILNIFKSNFKEKGYVYFQDFIPNNKFDTRIVVVGNRAIGERRFVRDNDFRASGSGNFSYDGVSKEIVEIAFKVSKILKVQSIAYDFVLGMNGEPLIVEISYGFGREGISKAPGYWDDNLIWHASKVEPEVWIIEDLLNKN
ncbi:ATP-grasp domain-containing protein [Myroides odoratimimus]|uniref:ATP-grasp domain-containing protein n=1 Tax=Myroides odoratimimus TaxID=76832 RepID=UPI003F428113